MAKNCIYTYFLYLYCSWNVNTEGNIDHKMLTQGDFNLWENCICCSQVWKRWSITLWNITYHDIIAFNQKLSVKGPRNFKSLRNFPGGSLNLSAREKENTDTYNIHKGVCRLFNTTVSLFIHMMEKRVHMLAVVQLHIENKLNNLYPIKKTSIIIVQLIWIESMCNYWGWFNWPFLVRPG